jgi:hypothetical protein
LASSVIPCASQAGGDNVAVSLFGDHALDLILVAEDEARMPGST